MTERKRPEPPEKERGPRRKRDGRDRPVIVEIVRRRMEGGAAPTPEAYDQALQEWQKLPGAVVRPPATIKSEQETQQPSDPSKPAPTPAKNAPDDGSS